MFRRPMILAGALAAALVPLTPAPGRAADAADVAKLVGGIATLYIVGRAVSQARADDDDDEKEEDRTARDRDREWREGRHGEWRYERLDREDRFDRDQRYGRSPAYHTHEGHGRDGGRNFGGRKGSDTHHWYRDDRGRGRHGATNGRHMTLPVTCQRKMSVRHRGPQIVMGPGCLARAGYYWRDLPQRCRVTVHARHGFRDAYASHCLQRAGYRIRD